MTKAQYNKKRKKVRDYRKSIVLKATGDSKLANSLRDRSDSYIANQLSNVIVYNNKLFVIKEDVTEEKFIQIQTKKEAKNAIKRSRYKEARDKGYTPDEARALRAKAKQTFENTIQFNKILSNQSRYDRWAKMSKNEDYDEWILEEVERINLSLPNGDINDSFGWNVVYMYYTEGGTIDFWESYFVADPLNNNIYRAVQSFTPAIKNRGRRLKE